MTREDAKKLLPIIQAWADGKTMQFKDIALNWTDVTKYNVYFDKSPSYYRIKQEPKPKYRPFNDRYECWNEMSNHQPFGWLKIAKSDEFLHLLSIGISTDFNAYFNTYTFADGSPFGIKEE